MILSERMELLGSRRNKVTITGKEAFAFISRKGFQRSLTKCEEIGVFAPTVMVLSGLFETEEAEAFARDIGNLEVRSRRLVVQVSVVVSTIEFRP